MYKQISCLLFFCVVSVGFGQEKNNAFKTKKLAYTNKEILVDTSGLNPNSFKIFSSNEQEIDTSYYSFNYQTKKLIFKKTFQDSVRIQYYHLPNFLTKTYTIYDEKKLYQMKTDDYLHSQKTLKNKFLFLMAYKPMEVFLEDLQWETTKIPF